MIGYPAPRDRWIAAVEILAAMALIVGNLVGILPFSSTPFLLLLAWMSLRLRRMSWREIGFTRPAHPLRTVAIGTISGVVFQFASLYALEPLLTRMTGALPDASLFSSLPGNVPALLITLLIVWSLAAFGEEIAFRHRARGLRYGRRGVALPGQVPCVATTTRGAHNQQRGALAVSRINADLERVDEGFTGGCLH